MPADARPGAAAIAVVMGVWFAGFAGVPRMSTGQTTYHLALDGDDANPGTAAKPFRTLERARDAVRQLKRAGLPQGGVTVRLKAGTYERTQTFRLTAEDSGTAECPIVYRAADGQEVRVIGGRDLPTAAFKPVTDEAVLQRLDEAARPHVLQVDLRALGVTEFGQMPRRGFGKSGNPAALELFFNDRPMTLARWPNEGFVETGRIIDSGPKFVPPSESGKPVDLATLAGRFAFPNDRVRRWTNADDLWVHGYWCWDWANEYLPVRAVDAEKREIALAAAHSYGLKEGKRFYVLNLLEELDRAGEWYLDRQTGLLYLWPPAPLKEARVTVSLLAAPITDVQGASHVTIRGLTIEAGRAEGVRIEDGSHVLIEDCTLRNLGTWAVRIGRGFVYGDTVAPTHGGEANGVRRCHIHDVGGGGILLSGGDRRTLTPAGNFATDNDIHDYGRIDRTSTPAIDVSGVGNRAAHNHIHHAPHIGIMFWGNDHVMELNHVHHLCQETADAGAFYIGRDWSMRGNVVRHNFIHDIGRFAGSKDFGGTMGVYLDDFASGTAVFGNVIVRVNIGLMLGGGHDNIVENNIFVQCESTAISFDARGLGWAKKCFDGRDPILFNRLRAVRHDQPPYSTRYPALAEVLEGNPAQPRGNRIERNVCAGRWIRYLDGMNDQKAGTRDNLLIADPGFVDPAASNYQLKADSPVFTRLPVFERIPFERIGPRAANTESAP